MQEYREISLRELSICLWERKWFILSATIVVGAVLLLITKLLITPKYQASIRMYVNNKTETSTSLTSSDMTAAKSLVDTYITIIQSNSLLDSVIKKTGGKYTPKDIRSMMSAGAVNGTEVFTVSITGPSAEDCAKLANAIADAAPDIITNIVDGSSVKVIDRASVPVLPVSPGVTKNTAIGAFLGFLLSSLIAVLVYMFDNTIYTEDDIKDFCTLPVLGIFQDFDQSRTERYGQEYKSGRMRI